MREADYVAVSGMRRRRRLFVMASAGVDFKCFADEPEYHSVGFVDSNAPPSRTIAFEWLWLANAAIAVALNALKKVVDALDSLFVVALPVHM